jgi:hypothetical protein
LPTEISDEHDKYTRRLVEVVVETNKTLKMEEAEKRVSRLLVRINGYAGDRSYSAVQHDVRVLRETLESELDGRLFLFMPPEESAYYDKEDLFGIKDRFPEANKEIITAGNCYATGSYTACVFHLMRAVEIGARKMVSALDPRKHLSRPVELSEWGELIAALDKGVDTLRVGSSKSVTQEGNV